MLKACKSILKVIAYFDVFNYPIKKNEIIFFLDAAYSEYDINEAINFLLENELIYKIDDFFLLREERIWIENRKAGNEKAIGQLKIADKVAKFLSSFPYVRGVAVSGSLSKYFADEKTDIDFFIITSPNRLWIARTFMHLFKKFTFLFKKQHWFCMNYYVDEVNLEIKEKNIYTATEVVTAMPMRGKDIFDRFFDENKWVKNYFPFYIIENNGYPKTGKSFFKSILESVFNNRVGNWLDDQLMKITLQRWQKKTKQKRMNSHGILLGMDAGKHYSKPVPGHLQEKIISQFNLKMEQLLLELESIRTASAV